ncbi:MAG: peptide chain release factor 2 [Candidatus Saccharimonadales bacterium]
MQKQLIKNLNNLLESIENAFGILNIEDKIAISKTIESQLSDSSVWNNPNDAQLKSIQLANLGKLINPWITLKIQVKDMIELIESSDSDDSLLNELSIEVEALEKEYSRLKQYLLFNEDYDDRNAIIKLSAGVGGTDAQDWTEMLERMYLRWAEKSDMQTNLIERSTSEEAGIKSSTIEVFGLYAYGKLKSEHGVHRLVRLSPFNSDNLRQTSFALIEVLPQIDKPQDIEINEKDLKIDVYKSGGHGGQSVNTTDSAVRITHIPTGIVVSIQNERSQLQNRETALKLLRSKLMQLKIEQRANDISDLRAGESANWGSQIRSYTLHPYTLVKDHRTKHEDRDVQAVLDGKIDEFIETYLEYISKK